MHNEFCNKILKCTIESVGGEGLLSSIEEGRRDSHQGFADDDGAYHGALCVV